MENKYTLSIRKILIINFGGIGDTLLSMPALKALRDFYPQAKITMLGVKRVCELAKNLTYIDEIFIFELNYKSRFFLSRILKDLKTLLVLRIKKFDLAINMCTIVSKKSALKMRLLLDVISRPPRTKKPSDEIKNRNFSYHFRFRFFFRETSSSIFSYPFSFNFSIFSDVFFKAFFAPSIFNAVFFAES